jgi:hypothetical protein
MNRIGGAAGAYPPLPEMSAKDFLLAMKLKVGAKKAGWRENLGNIEAG